VWEKLGSFDVEYKKGKTGKEIGQGSKKAGGGGPTKNQGKEEKEIVIRNLLLGVLSFVN